MTETLERRIVGDLPEEAAPERVIGGHEIWMLAAAVAAVAVAMAFPFRPVKFGVMGFFALVAVFQAMRRPAMGLALLAFSLPFFDLVPPSMTAIRGLNAETVLIVGAFLIWVRATQMYGRDGIGVPLGRLLLAYVLLIILSCILSWLTWHTSLFDLLAAAKNHLAFMSLLPVAFHVLRTRADQRLVVGAAMASLLLNCSMAIRGSLMAFLAGSLERHRAIALLAIQPNTFGAALAMYLPIVAVLAVHATGKRWTNVWNMITAGAVGFTLLLTLSRGAWLGAAAGLLVVGLYRSRVLLVVLVVMSAGYQFWVPQQAISRVEVTMDVDKESISGDAIAEDSTQMRIEQYKSLPGMMRDRPILGWGYHSFPQVFEKYGTLGRAKGAHSSYCQIGAEEGAVGLLVLAAVLFGMAWAGVRASRLDDPWLSWLGVGVIGATAAMAFCMTSGARFEPQKIFGWFWIMAGICEREGVMLRASQLGRAELPATVQRTAT